MSEEISQTHEEGRTTLPIEKGFPIERINEIASKESRARMHYRPIYTMHKWWARRMGCVFRAICLYSLVDGPENVTIREPGNNGSLAEFGAGTQGVEALIEDVDIGDPDSMWELYSKDVRVDDKKVLDPFMGGGTSLAEASRFAAQCTGYDLNPVAWFVTKKQLEGGSTEVEELEKAFEQIKQDVAEEVTAFYRTPCPNAETVESTNSDSDPLGLGHNTEYSISDSTLEKISEREHYADVMYTLWAKELDCVDCGSTVPLFNDYRVGRGRHNSKGKYHVFCPDCESVVLSDDWQAESTCSECGNRWVPEEGTVNRGRYVCQDCGAKYRVTDAIQEQDGYGLKMYGVEYYCQTCDEAGRGRGETKNYKSPEPFDIALYEAACQQWKNSEDLSEYVPDEKIAEGAVTASSSVSGNDVFDHGYERWSQMFNERQLLSLSKILRSIDSVDDKNAKEYLLLAFSDTLRTNSLLTTYTHARNSVEHIFKTNSFAPPAQTVDANVWGTEYGRGTFRSIWDMVISGVEYAGSPTERYIDNGETVETPPFGQPVGEDTNVYQGDMRNIDAENEYDAVITDPPYYDNIIYSEVSDYFYVWLKILLEDDYDCFSEDKTPRVESIVTNPYLGKSEKDFESDLHEAFSVIHRSLKKDGVLAFTYHHSDSESWGELLTALCDVGFEVTATYPVSADNAKFIKGEAVEFDIIIVARPADARDSISWNSLRRDIYRTAQTTRKRLEENRELSRGDIGVVEMGRCFYEYSKHHGKVERAGEIMDAKEVVDEIYGVIQHGSEIGEIDVFLDLLEAPSADYNELDKLTRGTNATPERMKDMRLYNTDDGFELGTWDNEQRLNYIQRRVDKGEELTDLDKAQFLRYRWEHGKSVTEYLEQWEITDDLRELCEGLADATGDDTYRNILESRLSDF